MSNPQSPAYREGIWEIRETSITARLPEGAWILQVGDIEFIRLQSGTENGAAYCDAFIKPRDSSRPYPVGRFTSEKEGICKVLGQFADWNHVPLLNASEPREKIIQAPAAIEKTRRQVIPFPKAPDYPLQAEKPPVAMQGIDPNQVADAQQENEPGQDFGTGQNDQPGQGFDPRQNYNPAQGYGPGQTWWQWAFNPANPQFKKTITIISLVAGAIILLGALGVFRGIRVQSISGPGIVGIYFLLRAMKSRKSKNQYGPGNPPPGSPWGPYPQQPGTWKTEYTGPASENPSGDASENQADDVSGNASEDESGNVSDDGIGNVSDDVSGNSSNDGTGNASEDESGNVSDDGIGNGTGNTSGDASGYPSDDGNK